jgi:hypothetical protein
VRSAREIPGLDLSQDASPELIAALREASWSTWSSSSAKSTASESGRPLRSQQVTGELALGF